MSDIDRFKQDIVFSQTLASEEMTFHSTWGLFSPRRIDDGSAMLIEKLRVAKDDVSLDLGCGYGAIGLTVAKLCPAGEVHMVDKDFIAIKYAKKNAAINGLNNCKVYLSNALSEVPSEVRFNNVMSNLPANVGGELLSIILNDASNCLVPGGKLYVVTITGLRKFIRRNFEDIFGNYEKLKQTKHYTVAMAVKQ